LKNVEPSHDVLNGEKALFQADPAIDDSAQAVETSNSHQLAQSAFFALDDAWVFDGSV